MMPHRTHLATRRRRDLAAWKSRVQFRPIACETLESRHLLAAMPIISEVVAANQDSFVDGDGVNSDWLELFNAGDQSQDLSGWSLTDDPDQPKKWTFPSVSLDAGATMLVFASGQLADDYIDSAGYLHTNFRLSAGGEYLALVRPDGTTAWDQRSPRLQEDVSYGVAMKTTTDSLLASAGVVRTLVPTVDTPANWFDEESEVDDRWSVEAVESLAVGYSVTPDDLPGLVGEWLFETQSGQPIEPGASAVGQVDETSEQGQGPFHGEATGGAPGTGSTGMTYVEDSPPGIESRFSLNLPEPESPDNHVAIPLSPDSDLAQLTQGDFRVEAWFKTTDQGRSILVGSYLGNPTALNLELHTSNRGRIYVQGPNGTTDVNVVLPTNSRDGNWHQLAGVRRGNVVELYFDGQLVGSANDVAGAFTISQSTMYLGRDTRRTSVVFHGSLDDVAFYGSAEPADPIAVYRFETRDGQPVRDGLSAAGAIDVDTGLGVAVGQGVSREGEQAGGINYSGDVPPALLGQSTVSLEIDENNRNVESVQVGMPANIANLTMGDFTLQSWFKTQDSGRSILMGSYTGNHNALNFELHTNNRLRVYIQNRNSSTTDLNVSVGLVGNSRDGQWHHATAVRRGTSVELYFDGVLVGQTTDTAGSFPQNAPSFYFGRDSRTADTRFDGSLDDIRLWDVALTPGQIEAMAAGQPPATALTNNLAGRLGVDLEAAMHNANASAFIQIPFDVATPHRYSQIALRMQYDDGFVAYLNGIEIARRNAPERIDWNSAAIADRQLALVDFERVFDGASRELLRAGRNVLSIHGMTASPDVDSFLIHPELLGSFTTVDSENVGFFPESTPGRPNSTPVSGFVDPPGFSVTRGFFEASDLGESGILSRGIALSTETEGATIRYTVDGSWPTAEHGTRYTEPIRINTTSTIRAAAFLPGAVDSETITHTYLFLEDVIRQPHDPGENSPGDPSYPLRFPSFHQPGVPADYEMDPRVVNDSQYADTIVEDLKSIPTMSLVMDMDDVFGQPRGIWANSENRGREWERLTSVEYFDPAQPGREFQLNSAIRIQGRASRVPSSSIKHAFRLLFKEEYGPDDASESTGGPTKLEFPLFEDSRVDRFDTLVLRSGYNYSYLHGSNEQNLRAQYIRERFMRESQRAMGQLSAHGTYVHLYVNGLYFGLYAPQERPDASFMAQHLGGEKEDYDVISAGEVKSGSIDAWNELLLRAREDLSIPENYAAVDELLDVDSLIDYMIVHIWGGTTDWPAPGGQLRNWVVGRNRTTADGFKFYVWDAEYSIQQLNDDRVDVRDPNSPAFIYDRLRRNDDFRIRFADRVALHFFGDGALTAENNIARYAALADEIDRAIVAESARWGDTRGDACNPCLRDPLWTTERDWVLESYMPHRTKVVLDQFVEEELYPTVAAPELSLSSGTVAPGSELEIFSRSSDVFDEVTLLSGPQPAWIHIPEDNRLGESWTAGDFVPDGAWMQGASAVGFDTADDYDPWITTDLEAEMYRNAASVFVRTEFNYVAIPGQEFDELQLRMRYDDAFVAYLNGHEVARSATMPSGNLPYRSTSGSNEARDFETFVIVSKDFPDGVLVEGRNVLAIHGVNRGANSNDFLIYPELIGLSRSDVQVPKPLWYTIDGTDPRLPGGQRNPNALRYDGRISIDSPTELKVRALIDDQWSALTTGDFDVGSGRLAITEIYYHPLDVTQAERLLDRTLDADDFEFLELQNLSSSHPVRLSDYALAGGVDFQFPPQLMLGPGETAVVVEDETAFRLRFGDDARVLGVWSGKLSNGGEAVRLLRDGELLFEIGYDDAEPWPVAADGDGASIQLRRPIATPDDRMGEAVRWTAAMPTPGSSPDLASSDFNQDGRLDASDVDLLYAQLTSDVPNLSFDLTDDGRVDSDDRDFFFRNDLLTSVGDVNLDGLFDRDDLIFVFSSGEYEDGVASNSSWADGDLNGDGEFDSQDLVVAFQTGVFRSPM